MNEEEGKTIRLEAVVDKEKHAIIFAESSGDFIDILFSFFIMPMQNIIRLFSNHNQPPTVEIGCMNKLYESIKSLDMEYFRSKPCKTMLLCPKNGAALENKRLKLLMDDGELLRCFLCSSNCTLYGKRLLSLYPNAFCKCGQPMDRTIELSENDNMQKLVVGLRDGGVFVKELDKFQITDELEVKPSSSDTTFPMLSKLGYKDSSTFESQIFNIGEHEVITLLKCSLVSKNPLTRTLLEQNFAPEFSTEDFYRDIYIKSKGKNPESNVDGKISVELFVNQFENIVCYAEACEKFVDLVCSLLTVPLGFVIREMQNSIPIGSLTGLYKCVENLNALNLLKSNKHKEMLISPKLAPGFSYKNHPLGIEEASHPTYCYAEEYNFFSCQPHLTSDGKTPSGSLWKSSKIPFGSGWRRSILTVEDPKSHFEEAEEANTGGFVRPGKYTITDNLKITRISQTSSVISSEIPFEHIEKRVVHVGCEEASRLLVASFVSTCALTNTFLRELHPGAWLLPRT